MYSGTTPTRYPLTKVKTPPGSLYGFESMPPWLPIAAIGGFVWYFFIKK